MKKTRVFLAFTAVIANFLILMFGCDVLPNATTTSTVAPIVTTTTTSLIDGTTTTSVIGGTTTTSLIGGSTSSTSTTTTTTTTTTTLNPTNTIYVSTTGNDSTPGDGTTANPYLTLGKAASVAVAGKTISLAAGTYSLSSPVNIPTGVSVQGAGISSTVLTTSSITASDAESIGGFLLRLDSGSNAAGAQSISNLRIDGNNRSANGLWVRNRNSVSISNVSFYKCYGSGARLFSSNSTAMDMTGLVVNNCTFTDSGRDFDFNSNGSFDSGDFSSGNLNIGGLDGAEIKNIVINDTYGYGIKFTQDGNFKNTKLHDLTIHVNESDALWGEDISIELWNLSTGNEIYNVVCNNWLSLVNQSGMYANPSGTENVKVYNVRMIDDDSVSSKEAIEVALSGVEIYNCYFKDKGFGIAIWINAFKNVTIRNNIFDNQFAHTDVAAANGAAVLVKTATSGVKVYNNVIAGFNTGIQLGGQGEGNTVGGIDIKNNAFLMRSTATGGIVKGSGNQSNVNVSHNLKATSNWTGSAITTSSQAFTESIGGLTESDNITGDPQFKKTGYGWGNFYKPATITSYVIDKGTDVGYGNDIGSFQYNGSFPDESSAPTRTNSGGGVASTVDVTINFTGVSSVNTTTASESTPDPVFGRNVGLSSSSISLPAEGVSNSTCLKIVLPNGSYFWGGAINNQGMGANVNSATLSFKVKVSSLTSNIKFEAKPILVAGSTGGDGTNSASTTLGPNGTPWPAGADSGGWPTVTISLPLLDNPNLSPGNYGIQLALSGLTNSGTIWIDDLRISP